MKLTKLVFDTLSNNTPLRLKIALELGIGEDAVKRAIQRKSKTLNDYRAIQIIKSETGLTEEQIFEQKTVKA
jgi:hypothetical protein